MAIEYPYRKPDSEKLWYERIGPVPSLENVVLNQGDIIKECPRYVPIKNDEGEKTWERWRYDVIVLSQSCGLTKGDLIDVDVCPVTTLDKFIADNLYSSIFMPQHKKEILLDNKLGKITPESIKKTIAGKIKSFRVNVAYRQDLSFYLLNRCYYNGYNDDYLLVHLGDHFTVNFDELQKTAHENGERLGLQSPYIEELAHAVGVTYTRVALPIVIDKESFKEEVISIESIPDSVFDELDEKGIIKKIDY